MIQLSNRRLILYITFVITILLLSTVFASFFKHNTPEYAQIPISTHNKSIGQIVAGTLIIQELRMQNEYLDAIEIELATWNRMNNNLNKLLILNDEFSVLDEIGFSSSGIKDNSFHSFTLKEPLHIGKDKQFFICLLSENGQANNCITAWTDTSSTTGKLYKESISKFGLQDTVKKRKSLLKGSLQIKTIEAGKNGFTSSFLFMFFLLGLSILLIFNIKKGKSAKNIDLVLLIIFIGLILVPASYFLFIQTEKTKKSTWENRMLATIPVFDSRNVSGYLPQLMSYIDDHIPFRDKIISYKAGFYYKYLNKSSFPNISIIGKNGWVFRTSEKTAIEGSRNLSKNEIVKIVNILHKRTEYYTKIGIQFYITLIPMKTEVYKEFLPPYYHKFVKNNFANELRNELKKDSLIKYIDLLPAITNAKEKGQVYYKNDWHWTPFGAFYAYKEIINHIKVDFPQINTQIDDQIEFQYVGNISWGDAYELCIQDYISEPYSNIQFKNGQKSVLGKKKGYPPPANFHLPDEYEISRSNTNTDMPDIVIIRDSFYKTLIELTSENFKNSTFIWDNWEYGINKGIIKKEKPDIVLLEAYIGFIPNILESSE